MHRMSLRSTGPLSTCPLAILATEKYHALVARETMQDLMTRHRQSYVVAWEILMRQNRTESDIADATDYLDAMFEVGGLIVDQSTATKHVYFLSVVHARLYTFLLSVPSLSEALIEAIHVAMMPIERTAAYLVVSSPAPTMIALMQLASLQRALVHLCSCALDAHTLAITENRLRCVTEVLDPYHTDMA